MASAKEYNMLFKLQAQLGREFTSSFAEAQRVLQQTRTKIQELNRQQADISAYQKQQAAVDNTARKLRDLQKEHDNIQREMQESESYSSSLENKLIEKQRAIENTTRALQNQTDKLNAQKAALQEAGFDTDHLTDESKKLTSQLDTLAQQEEEAAKEAEKYGNKGVAAFEAVGTALVASGIAAGIKAIYEAYGECVQIAGTFQETMHIAVTAAVVLLSIVSLILIIIAGFRKTGIRGLGVWACIALAMMFIGAIGQGIVPK